MTGYNEDFILWLEEQAKALRAGEPIDAENIAEELESLAHNKRIDLRHGLVNLIKNLIKLRHQQDERFWEEAKADILRLQAILNSPSLLATLNEVYKKAYPLARGQAALDLGIDIEKVPKAGLEMWREIKVRLDLE
jgi:hypothetical protein